MGCGSMMARDPYGLVASWSRVRAFVALLFGVLEAKVTEPSELEDFVRERMLTDLDVKKLQVLHGLL